MRKWFGIFCDVVCIAICIMFMVYGFMGRMSPTMGAVGWLLALINIISRLVMDGLYTKVSNSYEDSIRILNGVIEEDKETIKIYERICESYKEDNLRLYGMVNSRKN